MAELKDVRNDYHGVTTLTGDIDNTETNIALLAFKVAAGDSLTKFEMVDQIVDEYIDDSGIDTIASNNEQLTNGQYNSGVSSTNAATWLFGAQASGAAFGTAYGNMDTNNGAGTAFDADNNQPQSVTGFGPTTTGIVNGAYVAIDAGLNYSIAASDWSGYGCNDYGWNNPSQGNATIKLAYSDDGSSWTDVGVQIGPTTAVPGSGGGAFAETGFHRYWKLYMHSQGANGNFRCADFSLYGKLKLESFNATMTLQSTTTTAETTDPTTGDIVMLLEDAVGTATYGSTPGTGDDLRAYASRDDGTTWSEGTLTSEGTWGTNKKILVARDIDISSQPSGQSMKYRIETRNQSPNNPHTVTAAGGAVTSTTQQKYGTASMYTSGNSDYLTIPNSDEFNFGNSDFTIESWIYHTGTSGYQTIATATNTAHSTYWQFRYFGGSGNFDFWVTGDTNGVTFAPGSQLTVNTWNHLAISRNGNSWYGFLNGTQVGATQTNTFTMTDVDDVLEIGGPGWLGQPFIGYIDELRISNSARYTANFTPAVHTTDANTLLLLHMDGANSGTTFTDDDYVKETRIHATSLAWK